MSARKKEQLNEFENKALANYQAFSSHHKILTLPSNVFVIGVALSFITGFMLYWFAGIVFLVFYFYGMYEIHKDDPQAFFIWRNVVTQYFSNTSASWKTSHCRSTRFILMKR